MKNRTGMKIRKHTIKVLITTVITALTTSLTSCQSDETWRNVNTADSLTEANPQTAITFIDSINATSNYSKRTKMKLHLLKAKAQNKTGVPLDSAAICNLYEYYDDNGTANERMLARYITGCMYLKNGYHPEALQYFQEAAKIADTTSRDCDYKTLSRVYSQTSGLLSKEMSFKYALEAGKKSIKYAIIAKDTFNAISGYCHLLDCYYYNKPDSAISVGLKAAAIFDKYGYRQDAAAAYGVPIFLMVERGEIAKAEPYIQIYETNSGLYDAKTKTIKQGHEIYYYCKGRYYHFKNTPDSAEYFFRKELYGTSDFNNRQAAAKGLYFVYKDKGNTDSITKYAEMWSESIDSMNAKMSTTHLQQMRAKYDYSHNKRVAEQKTAETAQLKLLAVILLLSSGMSLFFILFMLQKHKKKIAETKQLNTSNTMYLLLLQKKEQELAENENAIDRNEQLISEKIAEIEDLRKKLNAIHGGISDIDNKNNILDAPLVYRLHELASTSHKAKQNEIDEFVNIVKNAMPCFFEELGKRSKLSNTEVAICCLVKLNFITSEISCLLNLSSQNLTNIRKRLNKKVFGEDGGAKDFDFRIRKLLPDN